MQSYKLYKHKVPCCLSRTQYWAAADSQHSASSSLHFGKGIKLIPCGPPLPGDLLPVSGYQLLHGCPQLDTVDELLKGKAGHCQHCYQDSRRPSLEAQEVQKVQGQVQHFAADAAEAHEEAMLIVEAHDGALTLRIL